MRNHDSGIRFWRVAVFGLLLLPAAPASVRADAAHDARLREARAQADALPRLDFDLGAWLAGQKRILGLIEENAATEEASPQAAGELARDADLICDGADRVVAAAREAEASRDGAARRDFDVRDFGARGDGVTDDGPALRTAIAAAEKTPWSRVVLPPGKYLIADADPTRVPLPQYGESEIDGSVNKRDIRAGAAHLVIAGARNLTLTGAGRGQTEIILGKNDIAGIHIQDSLHTFVRDLSIDHARLPFTQGTVRRAPDGFSLEFAVDAGFPEPTAAHLASNFQVVRLFQDSAEFGVRLHARASTYYMVESVHRVGDGLFRVDFRRPLPEPERDASLLSEGDRVVFYGRWRQLYAPLKISSCRNSGAVGVDIYSSPGVAINPEMNDLVVLDDLRVVPKPGTGRIAASNADGVFATANRIGPWIRHSTFRQPGDDYFNLLGVTTPLWDAGEGVIRINRSRAQVLGTFRPGDRLLLIDGRDYHVKQEVFVESSTLLKKDGELLAAVRVRGLDLSHVRTQANVAEGEIPDYFVNMNVQNPGAVVEGNAFVNGFRLVLRSGNALVEGNRVVTRFSRGTTVDLGVRRYGHGGESWAADNVLIRGNVFDLASAWTPFKCPFKADSRVINHGIVVEENDFVSPHLESDKELAEGFDPAFCENLRVRGNRFHAAAGDAADR